MSWKDHIEENKKKWIGQTVIFENEKHTVVDVDMNGALHIDKPKKYCETHTNPTTAIEAWKIKDGVYKEPTYTLETPDGDKWDFTSHEEAKRNQYLFGGTIKTHL